MWFSTCQIAVYLSNSEDLITRCFILRDNLCLKHTQAINFHKLLNFITILLCMPRLKAECTAEKHLTPVAVYYLKKLLKFVVTTSHRYIQDEFPWKSCLSWPFLVLYFFWCILSSNYIYTLNTSFSSQLYSCKYCALVGKTGITFNLPLRFTFWKVLQGEAKIKSI